MLHGTLKRWFTRADGPAAPRKPVAPLAAHVPSGAAKDPSADASALLDQLSDQDLESLNQLIDWKAYTLDAHGRRLGKPARAGKRGGAQAIPDRRIVLLNERLPLAQRTVTEIGCFEGIHTVGLLQFTSKVTAADARIENVVKTLVRTALYGCQPRIVLCDVERELPVGALAADVVHHVGVLYHLQDPVRHLLALGSITGTCLMLDTHIANEDEAILTYPSSGRTFRYKHHVEGGREDMFSGMTDHAKWLTLDTITALLRETGLKHIDVAETRQERNGPRVLVFATR